MKRNLMLQCVLAAFLPVMAVGASGGRARDTEPIRLTVTNNGDRPLTVSGTKDNEPVKGRQTADVELDDVGSFSVAFDTSGEGKDADASRSSEDRKAKLEIANKSASVITLVADGHSYSIEPGKSLSLTVTDLESVKLNDASAVATESVGNQAGSTETPPVGELTNQVRAGPEGKPAPEGATGKGGYHDTAGKGPGSPDYPGQPNKPGTAPGA